MSKARAATDEPSIESLLDSIRRAIHDETAASAPEPAAPSRSVSPAASSPRPSAMPEPPLTTEPVSLKRRTGPLPHLRDTAAETARRPTPPASRPFIAPLAPQLEGSLRDLKVSVQSPPPSGSAMADRTGDLLSLRSRIADLSATRERLARISAGGPSSFASVLGGYARPDNTARPERRNGFAPQLPPPPSPGALRGTTADSGFQWTARPAGGTPAPVPASAPASAPAYSAIRQPEAFTEADEAYIEAPLPDPAADDYAVDSWDAGEDEPGDMPETPETSALPVATDTATARAMLSQEVADATATAFDRLADTIVSQASGGARSIEDITRDLLRPMLKAWLDTNLQGVVERLVREEIDRVARRSGR